MREHSMEQGYFKQVAAGTQTRLWVNNPTVEEAQMAIKCGATACTTNPAYVARLSETAGSREETIKIIDQVIAETSDDTKAAAMIQQLLIAKISTCFMPLFNTSGGTGGFVSIQIDPRLETDPSKIVAEALADFDLFPNCIAKIPVTSSGLKAIDILIRLNKPVIATEIMALSQAIAVCDIYARASRESGNKPAFFVTHISGIFDEQVKAEAETAGVALSGEAMRIAGCAVAKKQYSIMQERKLPGILLGGGARGLHHFTEMVGGNAHVTLNWKNSIEALEDNPPPVENRIDNTVHGSVIEELIEKSPTFARAYAEDGLTPDQFEDFSPVVRFRNQFMDGWNKLLELIAERRKAGNRLQDSECRRILKVGEMNPVMKVPGVLRSTLVYNNENMLCHFSEKAGARVDLHTHTQIQSGYILSGKIKFFNAEGKEFILEPGTGYIFDSDEPHGSVAIEDSEIIECFTPMRKDYLD